VSELWGLHSGRQGDTHFVRYLERDSVVVKRGDEADDRAGNARCDQYEIRFLERRHICQSIHSSRHLFEDSLITELIESSRVDPRLQCLMGPEKPTGFPEAGNCLTT
jgi:hypothetical protein